MWTDGGLNWGVRQGIFRLRSRPDAATSVSTPDRLQRLGVNFFSGLGSPSTRR